MRIAAFRLALIAAAFVLTSSANAATARCDENCLLHIAGAYMDSLSANDPAGAPFAANVRTTENGKDTPTTQGIWKTGRGWFYRHTFVDPAGGQISALGTVREDGDADALVAIRLKVVDRKITESELLVARKGDFSLFESRAMTEPKAVYKTIVPANRRATRAQLADIPRRYFTAIATGDNTVIDVHPDANRTENGVQTTNSQRLLSPSTSEGLRRLVYMSNFRELRSPVIDVERGLVLGILVSDMPVRNEPVVVRGKPVEISVQKNRLPRSLLIFEIFKVENGQVTGIEAIVRDAPLGASMGWGGVDKAK